MAFVVKHIQGIMLVAGLATASMLMAAFAPQATLMMMFGSRLSGPLAEIIVRNWGLLIGTIGLMLIYAAFQPVVRNFVLVIAIATKLAFISLILIYGQDYLARALGSMIFDGVLIGLFAVYLMSGHKHVADRF